MTSFTRQITNRIKDDLFYTSSFRYDYVCCDLPVKCQFHKKIATPWDDVGSGNALYLDRHNVNCGTDSFLSAFKLNQQGSGRIRYNADCCRIPDKKSCYPAKTPFNDDGRGNAVYLDRHNVACRDNYAISRFRLMRNDKGDKIQYHFTCCTVKEIIKSTSFFLLLFCRIFIRMIFRQNREQVYSD